ncbi:MAG: LD-carboxypeptidase [Bacteroidales bacterium]|nr:LD-carboxypeptidase [Bacteroidales bacterium]
MITIRLKRVFFSLVASLALSACAQNPVTPPPLLPGAKIAIVTPASAIDSMVIVRAAEKITQMGYEPVVYPHAFGRHHGTYAANDTLRAVDLMTAFADPEISAILCARGGYGTNRLIPMLDIEVIKANPKWLIGYSDISVLHALMRKARITSIHGPMCGHIDDNPLDEESTAYLFQMLSEGLPMSYEIETHPYNKYGYAKGRLVGGNLLTINALSETPLDVLNIGDQEDIILYIEDVSEQIYAIERVLIRLHQSGSLANLKGLIIGEFTDYKPSKDFETMEDMIHYWLDEWGYYGSEDFPIMFGFPAGHGEPNYPLPLGAMTEISLTPTAAKIAFK